MVGGLGVRASSVERVNFLIAGAQKGGTSALAAFLSDHPEIFMAAKKELHFFDRNKHFRFGRRSYDTYHRHFEGANGHPAVGEATPNYLYWKPAPRRIYEYNPRIKLVFVLRNPIQRAQSHWAMNRKNGIEPHELPKALRLERLRALRAFPRQDRRYSYVDRGFYSRQIERMLACFDREQLMFLKNDELRDAHEETLQRVFDFLGVSHVSIPSRQIHTNPYDEMPPEVRAQLLEVFTPEIKRLETLLDWNCDAWLS